MKIVEWYKEKDTKIHISIFISTFLVIVGGCILLPRIFYDNWIWKYYWGPVVADAGVDADLLIGGGKAVFNGVVAQEGYTMISEITYGILVVIAIYFIYKLLKKLKIQINWRFCLALLPYIIFGPVTRTLEDTGYFAKPFVYWFISPLIYLQIAIYAIGFLLLGYYIEKRLKSPKVTVNRVIFGGGMILLIPSLVPIARWMLGSRWGDTTGLHFDVLLLVVGLVSLIVILVYVIAHLFRKRKELSVYKNPLNLAMLTGHLIDGITSYISIHDPLKMGLAYSEKHPASDFLLGVWGPLFPIVKFILIILVIYVFDVLYKEELKNHIRMINLLKIVILILGFSPGLRDILRVVMGV